MALNTYDEPQCWIAKLDCTWENEKTSVGTGFLVNFRDSAKHCIMTAGHNIVNKTLGSVKKIEASFPRGEKMTALGSQCFVSKIYQEDSDEVNDKDDYALIAIELNPGEKKVGGFGFSAVIPEKDLIQEPVFVYGYAVGKGLQGFESRLVKGKLKEKPQQLFHSVETLPGVSGGPVWTKHRDDYYTAIGIHNYGGSKGNKDPNKRATRLTVNVLRDMVYWAGDCKLGQSIEGSKKGGTYLKASAGKTATVLSRRGRDVHTSFDFIPIEAPPYKANEAKAREQKYRYLISPTATQNTVYLKLDPNSSSTNKAAFAKPLDARNPSGNADTAFHFSLSRKADKLISIEDDSKRVSTGPYEISPLGKNLLLRIRYTKMPCQCDCGEESVEVDFISSAALGDVKTGSALYLSLN